MKERSVICQPPATSILVFGSLAFLGAPGWLSCCDAWVAQLLKCLPLAQVMIPGSWDGATIGLLLWGSLLLSPSAYLYPYLLAHSLSNKKN